MDFNEPDVAAEAEADVVAELAADDAADEVADEAEVPLLELEQAVMASARPAVAAVAAIVRDKRFIWTPWVLSDVLRRDFGAGCEPD